MFEQESYNYQGAEVPIQPGDLFYNYEIKNWNFTPRLYKILAGSAILNILGLLVIGSTGMLTTRGCESPFVGRVCQVLDTVYLGSVILGTERDYVDAPYDKTELGDAEVTFIDVTGLEPPLSYPSGYFQLANPEQQVSNVTDPMAGFGDNMIAPGIPRSNPSIGGLLNTPQIMPDANPSAVPRDLPSSPLEIPDDKPATQGSRKGRRGGKITDSNSVADANTNQSPSNSNTTDTTPDPNLGDEKVVNSRPLTDLADAVNTMRAKGEFNLDAEFSVEAKGKLTPEGKLDKKTFRFTKASSTDPKMIDVVKHSIEAFNDTGMLQYLEKLSGKDLNLAIQQGKENVSGEVRSEVEGEERAKNLASVLNLGLSIAKNRKKDKITKLQAENNPDNAQALQNAMDELALLDSTSVVYEGKQLVVKFNSAKDAIHNLIQRKLDAQAKEMKKESGAGPVGMNNNTARK